MPIPKLQRWIDLLAALLSRRVPATFTELARDVPTYAAGIDPAGKPSENVKRMFERDKDDLRQLGVPIQTEGDTGDEEAAYSLRVRDFYLPYLAIVAERGVQAPAKVTRWGYGSLATLAFEPDELEAIADGARRVMQAGDAMLAEQTRSALRKLAFDLPLGATEGGDPTSVVLPPVARPDPRALALLGDALFRRKRVTFGYRRMGDDADEQRDVEPYGLFFLGGHWYLAAHDRTKDARRNFRVSRMTNVRVNATRANSADYEIPRAFSLREHAKSRQAWELGDGDAFEALVDFRGRTGAVMAAAALGRADEEFPTRRRFDVRRPDSFARWLLAFAGEAVPLAPPSLVREYAGLVERTRAVYEVAT